MKTNSMKMILAAVAILLLGGWVMSGCGSDSVAPNDEPPALSEENAGYQAAMVALALTEVGPRILEFVNNANKEVVTYNLSGYDYVDGSVQVDYRQGGAGGTPSDPQNADYAHLETMGENGLMLTWDEIPNSAMYLTASIMGTIAGNSVTILPGSGGTLTSPPYTATFLMTGLVFNAVGYPDAGSLTILSGGYTLLVEFNGTSTVLVSVDGVATWTLNLADGTLSPWMPPTL